jgi:hypothetical protein
VAGCFANTAACGGALSARGGVAAIDIVSTTPTSAAGKFSTFGAGIDQFKREKAAAGAGLVGKIAPGKALASVGSGVGAAVGAGVGGVGKALGKLPFGRSGSSSSRKFCTCAAGHISTALEFLHFFDILSCGRGCKRGAGRELPAHHCSSGLRGSVVLQADVDVVPFKPST